MWQRLTIYQSSYGTLGTGRASPADLLLTVISKFGRVAAQGRVSTHGTGRDARGGQHDCRSVDTEYTGRVPRWGNGFRVFGPSPFHTLPKTAVGVWQAQRVKNTRGQG